MKKRARSSYAWVINNLRKTATLLSSDRPKTNTELMNDVRGSISLSEKSNLRLSEFVERNLMKCLNPRAKKGRIYIPTDHGLRIAKRIAKAQGKEYHYKESPIDYRIYA